MHPIVFERICSSRLIVKFVHHSRGANMSYITAVSSTETLHCEVFALMNSPW